MALVDFSFARPSIQTLHAAGVTAVGRYLSTTAGKGMSAEEFAGYIFNGIAVWVVFEDTANDASGGYFAGIANAQRALAFANNLNWPSSRPIYFAVDSDIAPGSAVPYFEGINAVLPASRTGVYGEGALLQLLAQDGLAEWYWQSESTSFPGNASTLSITHIQQTIAGAPVAETDLDYAAKADFGQFPAPAPAPVVVLKNQGTDMATEVPTGGLLAVGPDGGVFAYNGARFYGSLPGDNVHVSNVIGIAATTTGNGYWIVGSDGGVYCFGDAQFHGSLPEHPDYHAGTSNDPCVGIVRDPSHAYGYILLCAAPGATPALYAFNETTS